MERLTYDLRINADPVHHDSISKILNYLPDHSEKGWSWEIDFNEEHSDKSIISIFLDSLEGKYDKLLEIGVNRDDISIWIIYGYNHQCNMEFNPSMLERIGKEGITLCISCFEAGE